MHLSSPDSSIAVKHLWPAMMLQRFRKSLISCKLLFKSAYPFCCCFEEAKNKVCLAVEKNLNPKQELSPVDSVLHHHNPKTNKKPPTIPLLALPTESGQVVEIQQEFRVARSPIANPSSCFDGSFFLQNQTQKQKQNRSCCSYKFVGIQNYLDRFSSDLFESDGMATNSDSGLCCLVFPLSCGNGKK